MGNIVLIWLFGIIFLIYRCRICYFRKGGDWYLYDIFLGYFVCFKRKNFDFNYNNMEGKVFCNCEREEL